MILSRSARRPSHPDGSDSVGMVRVVPDDDDPPPALPLATKLAPAATAMLSQSLPSPPPLPPPKAKFHATPYGCYNNGDCLHETRTAFSVKGWEGRHDYILDLRVEGWGVADYSHMDVLVTWSDSLLNLKPTSAPKGCGLVGYTSRSITLAGEGSGTDCILSFHTVRVRTNPPVAATSRPNPVQALQSACLHCH